MAVVSSCREVFGSVLLRAQLLFYIGLFLKKFKKTTFKKLLVINQRKVRMTSSPYGPYELGYTRATMIITKSYTIKQFGVNL